MVYAYIIYIRNELNIFRVYIDKDVDGKKVNIKPHLSAMNGKQMKSEIVFIAAFKCIMELGLENLHNELDQNDDINTKIKVNGIKDIQWIVTVPAIWNDTSKDKMLVWMKKAGLIDPNIKDHCILKYEPDCASLSLQYELLKKRNNIHDNNLLFDDDNKDNINYLEGSKYIIIDAGGGTVDVACHQFMNNYSAKELFHPSGGAWGDMYIDKAFVNILQDLLGCDILNNIKNKGNAYFDLLQNFKQIKMEFQDQNDGTNINIEIPGDFKDAINRLIGIKKFENMVSSFEYKGHKN